jgi:hypothetical protein
VAVRPGVQGSTTQAHCLGTPLAVRKLFLASRLHSCLFHPRSRPFHLFCRLLHPLCPPDHLRHLVSSCFRSSLVPASHPGILFFPVKFCKFWKSCKSFHFRPWRYESTAHRGLRLSSFPPIRGSCLSHRVFFPKHNRPSRAGHRSP